MNAVDVPPHVALHFGRGVMLAQEALPRDMPTHMALQFGRGIVSLRWVSLLCLLRLGILENALDP